MNKRKDANGFGCHLVDQAIPVNENLPDIVAAKFRHHPPTLRQSLQGTGGILGFMVNRQGVPRRIFGNKAYGGLKIAGGRFRPG
jgi:hypothetical protein